MNERDPLDLAVRALRDAGEPPAADVARTRARMLETLKRSERRGSRMFWVVLPIAAVLAASTALAKNGDVLRRAWDGIATTVGIAEPKPAALLAPPPLRARHVDNSAAPSDSLPNSDLAPNTIEEAVAAPSSAVLPEVARETAEPVAPLAAPLSVPAPAPVRTRAPRAHADAPRAVETASPAALAPEIEAPAASAPAPAASSAVEAASLAIYKKAYQLHFVEHRYAAAIVAWDDYLREVPGGRLTVEARYNRAIALVRLGRRQEAEKALQPFARGEVGSGYRMREARELMDALGSP